MGRDTILAIVGAAVLISILGVAVISLLSYTPPSLPAGSKGTSSFTWDDVYEAEIVSKARYQIISMGNGEMNKTEVLYTFTKNPDGTLLIDIVAYHGLVQSETSAGIKVDMVTFSCISKYYSKDVIPCDSTYPDTDMQLAMYALPTLMKKSDTLGTEGVESAIYKESVHQAVKLRKGNIELWVVKDIPLPVRIVISSNESSSTIIANLYSYN